MHPYAPWSNTGNPQPPWSSDPVEPPSVYGALPSPTFPTKCNLVTFRFTSFNPTILNCDVIGPNSVPYVRIVTDSSMPGYSVFRREGKNIALIEWQDHPQVEVRDILSKKTVSRWLGLSTDRSSRIMHMHGRQYIWAPKHNLICLYTSGPNPSEFLARISRGQGSVTLEIAASAIHAGLLEVSLVATVLLQCNRNID